ncbi:Ent-kaurene oxidase [Grifola frondosa]|uniref:Ent-kaurene oxidase n=1 Tax=Grifola frondosa TaxID=5627 RepID=A0A1C7M985_GRIFR|nr:Ent-kaurene oxidase [Grifola frondosa]
MSDSSSSSMLSPSSPLSLSSPAPQPRKLSHIPTIGPSAPLLSYYGVYKFLIHGPDMIREGYNKHKGSAFKIAKPNGWQVIVSGPSLTEELRKAGDDQLSIQEAVNETIQMRYTLGPTFTTIHIISPSCALTSRTPFPLQAMSGLRCQRWPPSGRSFAERATAYSSASQVFVLTPSLLSKSCITRGVQHLEGMILERYRAMEEFGDDWVDKPNDMLQWLMDVAQRGERTVRALVLRILTMNMAAIHTSSVSFTQALYYLAANPEFVGPLREEVDAIISTDGWSKAAMDKMRKIDSFLKESQRIMGASAISMERKAMRDVVLGDGTFIRLARLYRWLRLCTTTRRCTRHRTCSTRGGSRACADAGEGTKHQMVTTSTIHRLRHGGMRGAFFVLWVQLDSGLMSGWFVAVRDGSS